MNNNNDTSPSEDLEHNIPVQLLSEIEMKKKILELQLANITLRDLLKQMLNVAENCDETGYCMDTGFVDINTLHKKIYSVLGENGNSE